MNDWQGGILVVRKVEYMISTKIRHIQKGKYELHLKTLLEDMITMPDVMILSRVKALNSAIEKFNRKRYKDINQIEDLLGMMIIVPNKEKLYQIANNIEKKFSVLKIEDYIKQPKEYGYQSYHMIIQFYDIKAEIQIKTVKQKLACDMTHHIYKCDDLNKYTALKALFSNVL